MHNSAFGCIFAPEQYESLVEYLDNELKDTEFSTDYNVDFIFAQNTIYPELIFELNDYKSLWGQGVDTPLIAVEGIKVTRSMITLMSKDKNPTIKIALPTGVACIKFKSSEEEYEQLCSPDGYVKINLVGKCEVNEYQGQRTAQLLVQDYEIVDQTEYYF